MYDSYYGQDITELLRYSCPIHGVISGPAEETDFPFMPFIGEAVQPYYNDNYDGILVKFIMNDPPTVSVTGDVSGVIGQELNFAAIASDDIDTPKLFWNYGG